MNNIVKDSQQEEDSIIVQKNQIQKDRILAMLKMQGCRITRQRKMLLDIILEGDCSSCKEIYYKASEADSGIGIATVYRMVNILEDLGAISRRNMYRVREDEAISWPHDCVIAFNDGTRIELSEREWNEVVCKGLRISGYPSSSKILSVTARLSESVL